ncbi:WD and tetratricopeptide repeats protein 1 [Papilio machaon]|uniref:WD and tetratricopeptide repeats protein 1 n=1 Tax=Papilio machaon TaxID=76193 RepID=A0A194RFE5_PAPMA|nr:WD and tetratricopeptide repeats protein 1 [Papilio machaon]
MATPNRAAVAPLLVYLFDINSGRRPILVESFIIQHNHGNREGEGKQPAKNGTTSPANGTSGNGTIDTQPQLPDRILQLKEAGNELVNKGEYIAAVDYYNSAIAECPDHAVLYSNRAATLMRRGWSVIAESEKDCYKAIKLDPNNVKSHFRLAKGLMELKRPREAHECLLYFKDKFPRHAASHAVFLLQKDINVALENIETLPDEVRATVGNSSADENEETLSTSLAERQLRAAALDYSARFLGHCNTTTDIKEAIFLGPRSDYVAAGSDDGSLFIWCRSSGNVARCLRADESILNCVQMHPTLCLLATSGIEAVVRLWSPRPEDGCVESRVVSDLEGATYANQQRMRSDPFEAMLFNISFAGAGERDLHPPACRTSSKPKKLKNRPKKTTGKRVQTLTEQRYIIKHPKCILWFCVTFPNLSQRQCKQPPHSDLAGDNFFLPPCLFSRDNECTHNL